MHKYFDDKILYLVPIVFFIIVVIKVFIDYSFSINSEFYFAKKEAQVLNTYFFAHRNYYQKLFADNVILLNKNTIKALPLYSSSFISNIFSKNNKFHIILRTVSDRVGNPKNSADKEELRAIEYFKKNRNSKEYFRKNSNFYQYASALRVDKKCLIYQGSKRDVPAFIKERYSEAYSCKQGDVRGIISIKIPTKDINNYLFKNFLEPIISDCILFILLFLGIFRIIRRTKNINQFLESEIKEKTLQLSTIYLNDKLTNLPNRSHLIEDIGRAKNLKFLHLAFINIDGFKDINDFYGYDIGDDILRELGNILKENCHCKSAIIYKLPSDEYALFSNDCISKEEFFEVAHNLISIIDKTEFNIENNGILISLSCGIATGVKNIMRKADMALRMAKSENKSIVVYNNNLDLSTKIKENAKKISLLRNAIENNNITPYFQPIYNLNSKNIEKYECLVRIVQNNGVVVPPSEFLDIAMKSKQYPSITKSMLDKSFEFFKDKNYEFSINISILDIVNSDTIKYIVRKLQEYDKPQKVVFEILEDDEIKNFEKVKEFIEIIKKFGCKFALDDFGSGYSNFSYVYELNLDYIKIDASLVKNITIDDKSKIITKAIIDFASALNIKTIAEYVEDKESLELLQKLGIDFIQGYYIGKPNKGLI
ncbi:MAG: EAL domain-containing protein [Epsilonproteobacteria bacterium]|nr:EAL domain-containing protein [Campylobacterota bacterium]